VTDLLNLLSNVKSVYHVPGEPKSNLLRVFADFSETAENLNKEFYAFIQRFHLRFQAK